jgi:hypothetical protein
MAIELEARHTHAIDTAARDASAEARQHLADVVRRAEGVMCDISIDLDRRQAERMVADLANASAALTQAQIALGVLIGMLTFEQVIES